MPLFNLGINNVKHNFKNYVSYFISILTSVWILMIFYSIYYNKHIQSFDSGRVKIRSIFKAAAFLVILFSIIFIWYANSYFIKNKKKEIAIYSLVGMKKREIGLLMFFENIFLGVAALIIGIPLGAFSSTFFLKLLTMCIKSSTPIKYNFDIRSVIVTFLIFMAIFLLNSIKAYKVIYKFRLIELLHAEKEGEKQPKFSKILSLVSVAMLISSYFIALKLNLNVTVDEEMKLVYEGILILMLNIAGTYILFNNMIIFIFKVLQKNKKVYYKGENLIGISQLIFRIKGNSSLLATIVLILSTAIVALCFTFSFYMSIDEVIPNGAPFSVTYQSGNEELDKKVEDIINDDGENNITYKTDIVAINGKGLTENYTDPKHPGDPFDILVISESQYNEIIENSYFNKSSDISERATDIKINGENQCFFIEVCNLAEGRGRLTGDELNADIGGKSYDINISDSDVKSILGVKFQKTTVVVRDTFFNQLLKINRNNLTIIKAYNFNNPLKNEEIVNNISKIMPDNSNFYSYYSVYIELHTLYGCFSFIGAFIGILLVFSTGSIMYYKQLMEAQEDKNRYIILSKIGLTKKETLKIVFKQIGFIFVSPLLFAIVNSTVVLWVYVKYVANGGSVSTYLIECILVTMAIYILIYLLYYLISVRSYMKIIRSTRA
ncbi:MAG: FtsX-like permease family protein [Clostridium sp.]